MWNGGRLLPGPAHEIGGRDHTDTAPAAIDHGGPGDVGLGVGVGVGVTVGIGVAVGVGPGFA